MQAESARLSFITFTSVPEFRVPMMQELQGKKTSGSKFLFFLCSFLGLGQLISFVYLDPAMRLCNRIQGQKRKSYFKVYLTRCCP